MTAHDSSRPVGEIVDRLSRIADRDEVEMRALFEEFGQSSFLPALMLPALLVVSPLSGIPLFSTVCGLTIAFISAQMLVRRRHLWLPDLVMRRRLPGEKARKAVTALRKVSNFLDRAAKRRARILTSPPFRQWFVLLCMLCGLAMPFLELVPFSSSLLGSAVLLMATALLARDGLFAILGGGLTLCAAAVPFLVFNSI